MSELESVYNLLQAGGPTVVSIILFYMWREEKKEKLKCFDHVQKLEAKIMDIAISEAKLMAEIKSTIEIFKDRLKVQG